MSEKQKGCMQGLKPDGSDFSEHSTGTEADGGKALVANLNDVDFFVEKEKDFKPEDKNLSRDCYSHCAGEGTVSTSANSSNSQTWSRERSGPAVTAVEVLVSGLEPCSHCVSQSPNSHRLCLAKSSQQNADCVRDGYPLRPHQNLSKSPISLINLGTGSNQLHAFREIDTANKEQENLRCLLPAGGIPNPLSSNTELTPRDQSERKCFPSKALIQNDVSAHEMISNSSDHPTARRRLSKTIQNLQEKLQNEMENNENRYKKHNSGDVKVSELKKFSSKVNSRFMRERSRKRSKSRVSFKVFQCARKYPPVHTKERPYRHWAGVGNCVTSNSRYIVSSTGICIPKTDEIDNYFDSTEATNETLPSDSKSERSRYIPAITEEEKYVKYRKQSEEEAANTYQLATNTGASCIQEKHASDSIIVDIEDKTFDADGEDLMTKKPDLSSFKSVSVGDETHEPNSQIMRLALKTDNALVKRKNNKELTEREKSLKSFSSTRERSRCIRRTPLGVNKRNRPPTPHSEHSCHVMKEIKQLGGTSKTNAMAAKWLFNDGKIDTPGGISNTKEEQLLRLKDFSTKELVPKNSQGKSPCSRVRQKSCSPSKPKLTTYGTMRASKMFIAASKQQKKSADSTCRFRRNAFGGVKSNKICSAKLDPGLSSPCEVHSPISEDNVHHGSLETLWSDVSTTTWESSVMTESSSSWYRKDMSENPDDASSKGEKDRMKSTEREGANATKNSIKSGQGDTRSSHTRQYMDVRAVVDFKGSLPGQLSFRKGQMIKQLVFASPASADGMSYGYYRTGALKRKKKGLFPSLCVTPHQNGV